MKQITIYSEALEQLFKTLKDSLSKDESRPILKWIKVEVEKNKLTAIALDGYMLSTIQIEGMYPNQMCDEDFVFFIKPFYIPKYKAGCEVTFNCDEKQYVVTTVKPVTKKDTLVYKFYQPTEQYIDWKKVMPETSKELKITVDASKLIRVLKGYQNNLVRNNDVTISFVQKESGSGINPIAPMLLEQKTKTGINRQSILLPIRTIED